MGESQPTSEEADIVAAYGRRQRDDDRYSWFRSGYAFSMQLLERDVLDMLARHGYSSLATASILDLGCGTGQWLRDLVKWGATPGKLTGVDLLPDRVAEARRRCPAEVSVYPGNGSDLEMADGVFDIVLQSLMLTSVLSTETRQRIASEMVRVVKPGGLILCHDFYVDNPKNPDVRAVKKSELLALFRGCTVDFQRVGLAPPLCRAIAPYSTLLCAVLAKVPPLQTHFLAAIRPSAPSA